MEGAPSNYGRNTSQITALLTPPSQLLLRHLDEIAEEIAISAQSNPPRVLIVGYPADDFVAALADAFSTGLTAFTWSYPAHRHALSQAASVDHHFGATLPPPSVPYDAALIFLPQSRDLLEMTLAMVRPTLHAGALVALAGEKRAGIGSARKPLTRAVGPLLRQRSGNHSVLLLARVEESPQQSVPPFVLDDWALRYKLPPKFAQAAESPTAKPAPSAPAPAPDEITPVEITTLPGVFSRKKLDDGTALLLDYLHDLPVPTEARVLDFGCGAGVIGAAVKRWWTSAHVTLVDANALALAATQRTLAANDLASEDVQLSAADVFAFEDVANAPTEGYTHILSNPPFHSGVQTDYHAVEEFLRGAARHLARDGQLVLVANRFLPYETLLAEHIGPPTVAVETTRYCIYASRIS